MTTDASAAPPTGSSGVPALSRMGWVGFVVALLTLAAVVMSIVGWAGLDGFRVEDTPWTVWTLLYAGGLAWSWWRMRPRPETRDSFALAAGGLLFQGMCYLFYWAGAAASRWDATASVRLPFEDAIDLMGLSIILALVNVLFVGPIFGLLILLVTTRGGWMALTQLFGLAGFLYMVFSVR